MPSAPDPHGWNSWPAYLGVHDGKLAQYRDHFLIEDRLEPTITQEVVHWNGELICADGYEIHVRKLGIVDMRNGVPWVKTVTYSYQALVRKRDQAVKLFRYDNIHAHFGHATEHHRHRFDENGIEILPPMHMGESGWPNLGQVLDELHERWSTRGRY